MPMNKEQNTVKVTMKRIKSDGVCNLKDAEETVLPQSNAASAENTQTGVDYGAIFAYK